EGYPSNERLDLRAKDRHVWAAEDSVNGVDTADVEGHGDQPALPAIGVAARRKDWLAPPRGHAVDLVDPAALRPDVEDGSGPDRLPSNDDEHLDRLEPNLQRAFRLLGRTDLTATRLVDGAHGGRQGPLVIDREQMPVGGIFELKVGIVGEL